MSKFVNLDADVAPTKQALALVNASKAISKMVLLPNAEPVLPLNPLTGFALSAKGELTLKDGALLDPLRLFKGRAIVKVLDMLALPKNQDLTTISALIKEKITPVWFYETAVEALRMALETLNLEALDSSNNYIPLARSEYVQNSAMLVENFADGDMFVIVEASASPSRNEDSEQITALFSGTIDEMIRSRIYKIYYRSVKAFRTHAALILHDLITLRLFGVDDKRKKPTPKDVVHYETNLVKELKVGECVIFSDAFDGEEGALIYAGPYHNMLWVNHAAGREAAQRIRKADLNDALPYDTPTTVNRFNALEHIIMDRITSKKASDDDDEEEEDEDDNSNPGDSVARKPTLATRTVHQRDGKPNIISASAPSIPRQFSLPNKQGARLKSQYLSKGLMSTVVWQESPAHLPVAVADELIRYHAPADEVKALVKLGLGLDDEENVTSLRIFLQAIAPVSTLDQLMIWRAAHSAAQRLHKQ